MEKEKKMSKYLLVLVFLLAIPSVMAENNVQLVFDRMFLTESNINGICEDGENLIIDKDCNPTLNDLTSGSIFGLMWFFRLVLIITAILYFKESQFFPLSAILSFALFIYHGAFGVSQSITKPGVDCSVFNIGHCFFPQNAFFGWILVILVILLTIHIIKDKNKLYHYSRTGGNKNG